MTAERKNQPWPTELRLGKDRKSLAVAFDNGERCELPAEYLRIKSPSAEVQGHSPAERIGIMRAVNAIDVRANIERACAERIARSALHMLGQIRLALEHFRRWSPVRPLFLVGDGMDAVPGVAVAADAHAVTQRTIG